MGTEEIINPRTLPTDIKTLDDLRTLRLWLGWARAIRHPIKKADAEALLILVPKAYSMLKAIQSEIVMSGIGAFSRFDMERTKEFYDAMDRSNDYSVEWMEFAPF